ncbi:hypothetical protein E3N88_32940 [Mikania micrantha]|uniref:Reverse transcriptase zinc-binding domain-containing protein n=1 Tax=Mikania micrantha TaxID=192012 RepID=A0A5N6M9Z9_9ASTR|nr:hypothetical protein E3N88_32940 [Mikania micrantha]
MLSQGVQSFPLTYVALGKDFEHLKIGLDAIKRATENFDNKYCIGSGGFGVVYRADSEHFDSFVMKDNNKSEAPKKCSTVAIKCITKREDTQGEQGFIAEIETLNPKLQEESYEKGFTLSKGPNKDSLHIFSKIGYQCLSEKQEHRPTMKAVIKELEEALKCQSIRTNQTLPKMKLRGTLDELVFKDIKNMIVPASLRAYQSIAYECLHYEREKRPTASMLVSKLKEALRFQEDIEIWKEKLPKDSKEIIKISKTPDTLSNLSNKELYEKLSEGIFLKRGKSCLSVNNNGERNEIVSATMFSYVNKILHKPISLQNSRFKRVVKSMDITNLRIQIKIKTQLLSPNVIYGAHLVFKFCDPRKFLSKLIYVNLKYKMGSETLHAYFATHDKDEWMTIELCRFISRKKDINFKVLLESLSRYYCGSGAIYVEGILFRAIDDATFKVKPNSDSVQQLLVDYDEINEITQLEDDEKSFSPSMGNEKSCHMLPAKMVLYPESSNVKCFKWKSLAEPESRFLEVAELLPRQVFRIKCKIETQKLSPDTDYACYLVFKLSQKCHGLQCPVKVRDVLLRKNKEFQFLYLRSPKAVNLHTIEWVPKLREDGLMEVIVWIFNSGNTSSDDHHPMSLKLRCYEGTMSGLVVYGIEFRHASFLKQIAKTLKISSQCKEHRDENKQKGGKSDRNVKEVPLKSSLTGIRKNIASIDKEWLKRSINMEEALREANGFFSTKEVRLLLEKKLFSTFDRLMEENYLVPKKVNFFFWRILLNRLPTLDTLAKRNVTLDSLQCVVCKKGDENVDHLFSSCYFAKENGRAYQNSKGDTHDYNMVYLKSKKQLGVVRPDVHKNIEEKKTLSFL